MDKHRLFLQDLVLLLKDKLESSIINQSDSDSDFNQGIRMGIYECLDLIKQQANAFDIPLSELKLDDYPLEDYL